MVLPSRAETPPCVALAGEHKVAPLDTQPYLDVGQRTALQVIGRILQPSV